MIRTTVVEQDRHIEMLRPQDRLLYRIEHPQCDIAERVPVKDEPRRRRIKINNVFRLRTTTVATTDRRP
jgi:hypothetical protein